MDANVAVGLVEKHLVAMAAVRLDDPEGPHDALGSALAAVGAINQSLASPPAADRQMMLSVGGIVEKLETWIKRLVAKLTEIVKALAKGTSFSLSVGTGVSVTINFPPVSAA